MRREAAASAEALAAEQAAKFAAKAEAKELQRFLDDTNSALQKQQDFSKRLGTDAAKAKEDLKAALADRSELVLNNQGLTQVGVHAFGHLVWAAGGGRGGLGVVLLALPRQRRTLKIALADSSELNNQSLEGGWVGVGEWGKG